MALPKAAVRVLGKARVCGSAPAPGATGRAAVGEACGVAAVRVDVAVPAGVAAGGGDPASVAVFAGGADDGADGPPHPPSTTPASAGPASPTPTMRITSGSCRDNLMPSPAINASAVPDAADITATRDGTRRPPDPVKPVPCPVNGVDSGFRED